MIDKIIQSDSVFDYLLGLKKFPDKYGVLDISKRSTKGEISYFSWDLTFADGVEAERPDNAGNDEVQIIFNLNTDISWEIYGASGQEGKTCVKMKAGEVCIYRNNDARTAMYYEAGTNFKFKSLQMTTRKFLELIAGYFEKKDSEDLVKRIFGGVEVTAITPEMYRILSEIDSADRYKEYRHAFLEAKMIELTALVLFGIAYHKREEKKRGFNPDKNDADAVGRLRERIQMEPYADYDAALTAEKLSMSVSKLNRVFRSLYGTSLHQYVTDQRLEYAAGLIGAGETSVTEIALKAGYNNLSHFAKSFAVKYGMTPKKFIQTKNEK